MGQVADQDCHQRLCSHARATAFREDVHVAASGAFCVAGGTSGLSKALFHAQDVYIFLQGLMKATLNRVLFVSAAGITTWESWFAAQTHEDWGSFVRTSGLYCNFNVMPC
jgi:hypothetical protein